MLTTDASTPSTANAFCASTARLTSDPVASKITSAVSFLLAETTYAPFATFSYVSSFAPSNVGRF